MSKGRGQALQALGWRPKAGERVRVLTPLGGGATEEATVTRAEDQRIIWAKRDNEEHAVPHLIERIRPLE